MVRWICSATLCEKISMSDLRTCMGISSIEDVIGYNRLHWFGHLQSMDKENWPRKILNFEVNSSYPRGCPKKKWFNNIRSKSTSLAQDHSKWRNPIKPSKYVGDSNHFCGEKKDNRMDDMIIRIIMLIIIIIIIIIIISNIYLTSNVFTQPFSLALNY